MPAPTCVYAVQYEPCGLTQMLARSATARCRWCARVGGLATPCRTASRFMFDEYDAGRFMGAAWRTARTFQDGARWRDEREAMSREFSWSRSEEPYLAIVPPRHVGPRHA